MRLIDADALKKANGLDDAVKYGNQTTEQRDRSYSTMMLYEIADMIDDAPTLEVEPVRRGVWTVFKPNPGRFVCSNCNKDCILHSAYCPNCGAKMSGRRKRKAELVRHGRWEECNWEDAKCKSCVHTIATARCSECNRWCEQVRDWTGRVEYEYCPHCGVKMGGGEANASDWPCCAERGNPKADSALQELRRRGEMLGSPERCAYHRRGTGEARVLGGIPDRQPEFQLLFCM